MHEAKLNVGVYALFRTNLGIVSSTICMNSGFARAPWEADFCDLRASLPIPEPRNLSDFKLDNSLSIRCLKPNMDWQINYDDGAGTTIDVLYRSIMPPFDIHDPDMDPMKAKALKAAEAGGKFAWGTAYNGHFDQSGHFQGTVSVRGKSYPIDCISTMDHSWGPRPERGAPNMSWLHAHFSRDLAMHAIFSFDPQDEWPIAQSRARLCRRARKGVRTQETRTARPCAANAMRIGPPRPGRQRRPRMEAQRRGANHFPLAVLAEHGVVQRPGSMAVRRSRRLWRDPGLLRNAATDRAERRSGDARVRGGLTTMSPLAVLFDFDGTLVQTREASWKIFARVNECGFKLGVATQQEYFRLLEDNLFQGIRRLCRDDAQSQQVARHFLARAGGPLRNPISCRA